MAKKTTTTRTPARKKKTEQPLTTAQQLGSLIKSARDIMRKDKGLNGDLDRLPMLTWIMFLKFLDDMEQVDEESAKLEGKRYKPVIGKPYRWRDWAAQDDGITGDELIAFVNQEEAVRPDGSKGPGLLAYLRSLQSSNGKNRRDVVAQVFSGVVNRMINGYLLRDVINKIDGIHFNSSEELHTLGALYESMLREMRDAAGDSGEFYTPRPVVQFMVAVTNPQLGETVLDPACGTGGFLAEAFEHLSKQVKTVQDRKLLQEQSLFGQEAKSLPYILAQMNMVLHGLEYPSIDYGNSLARKVTEIGDRDRFDIILTNPPFGGEEETGIKNNFPADKQTSETAMLFLQLIMRLLKRPEKNNGVPGRAAVVVPNGTLYATGIAARIREELLTTFNLHTVVRLPKGVFEPYADIPTNILFFDRQGPMEHVWFYEHPLPAHRAVLRAPCYSQSDPLQFDEFEPLIAWWNSRDETRQAWRVSHAELREADFNLDQKNPHQPERPPVELAALGKRMSTDAKTLGAAIDTMSTALADVDSMLSTMGEPGADQVGCIGDFCEVTKGKSPTLKTQPGPFQFVVTAAECRTADHYDFDCCATCVPMVSSTGHGHAAIHRIHYAEGRFALANIMAAIIPRNVERLHPKYLYYYLWHHKNEKLVSLMAGTANTSLTLNKLSSVKIAFPDIDAQRQLVTHLDRSFAQILEVRREMAAMASHVDSLAEHLLHASLGCLTA